MTKYFLDYVWIGGKPFGIKPAEPNGIAFKIISDPYFKHITIERYTKDQFTDIVYDSALLDFRHLRRPEHAAWQKNTLTNDQGNPIAQIHNQDDRLIFIETYRFVQDLCKECYVTSPHGFLLSIHRMYYSKFGDPFDGVILFDRNDHPVMIKRYQFDEVQQQYTELLEEQWDMNQWQTSSLSEKIFKSKSPMGLN